MFKGMTWHSKQISNRLSVGHVKIILTLRWDRRLQIIVIMILMNSVGRRAIEDIKNYDEAKVIKTV